MRRTNEVGLRILVEVAEVERDALVGVVAAPAARNIEQNRVAAAQQALGRTDRLHGDAGADCAGRAVKRRRKQAVFAEAGKAEHILRRRLIVARNAHRAVIEHRGADFRAQTRLAQTGTQQRGRDCFEHLRVDFAGVAHAVELVFTLDRAQSAQNAVDGGRGERQVFLEHGELLERHGSRRDIDGFWDFGEGRCDTAEAAERTNVREARVADRAFVGMAHEKHRLVGRDDERTLLHGAGEVIQVDFIVEQNHLPVGMSGRHDAAQLVQPRGQLGRRYSSMWHGYPSDYSIYCYHTTTPREKSRAGGAFLQDGGRLTFSRDWGIMIYG